jgi:arsenate reductase (thioredoxin)
VESTTLTAAVTRLTTEFGGRFDEATVRDYVTGAYDTLATRATTTAFLPLLAERFARQRLQARVRVDDASPDAKPAVLFLCVHNAGRSQMALGWFTHLAGDRAVAWSGGSEPGNEINPAVVAAMREVGIDVTGEYPKPWTDEIVRAADVVVTMGCGDECPFHPGKRYEDWVLEDPAGQGVEAVRPIRDEIRGRVVELLESLGIEVERLRT